MSVADAVLARLTAWAGVQQSLITIYDTTVPGEPVADPSGLGMYVVVSVRTKLRSPGMAPLSSDAPGEVLLTLAAWLVNSTRSAADACRWLISQVQGQLADWTPDVPGLVVAPLRQVGDPLPTPEETLTDRHLIFATDQFAFDASRIF